MTTPLALSGVTGRFVDASNLTFLATDENGSRWIYKPGEGEQPLWDFPGGQLWRREIAFYELDHALGFGVVPETVDAVGPFGSGSAQRYIEHDSTFDPRTLLDPPDDRLWPISVLDVIANNADRKLGHVLTQHHHLWAIDNGLTFHPEDKLRTVLWVFAGAPIPEPHLNALDRLRPQLGGQLGERLRSLVGDAELTALQQRIDALCEGGVHPNPPEDRHVLPWPLW